MASQIYTLIRSAVVNKQQVIATYGGYIREMCPHVIGFKNGVEHALFYQFGGETSRGRITHDSPHNWRCLELSKLSNVSVRNGEWHTSTRHSERQECVDQVDVQVRV
ncbi:MAG: hypothetical protein ACOYMV_12110 [Verrucomicrobiia bacterium]